MSSKTLKKANNFTRNIKLFSEPIFKTFYDNFLKLNKQKDGLEGYSKFVGLMIGMEKK